MLAVFLAFLFFLYDLVTFPIYFILNISQNSAPKKGYGPAKLRKTGDNKATITIGYKHDLTTSNRPYAEIILAAKVNTVYKAWKYVVGKHNTKPCVGTREVFGEEDEVQTNGKVFKKLSLGNYTWTTYAQAWDLSQNFGRGLRNLGIKSGDKIAIYAETRQEWIISAFGAFSQNITVCTLYTNLGIEAVAHGVKETEARLVITSHDLLNNVIKMLPDCPRVESIVYFKDPLFKTDISKMAVTVESFENVVQMGTDNQCPDCDPDPEDIAIIMYTSGSTGVPKGVMLTHGNIVSTAISIFHLYHFDSTDVYLAYLPLAHIFELLSECTMMMLGIPIGFSSPYTITDSSTKIKRGQKGDVSLLFPTVMCAVPLMLDRIYKSIKDAVHKKGAAFQTIFNLAYSYKLYWRRQGYGTPLMDLVIFNKLKALMGGRMRIMLSGGAPLSPETHDFVRTCLGTILMQGYSMTESCCSGTITEPRDLSTGNAGLPLAGVEIRLIDWEEGNYRVTDKPSPRGEILVGGKSISKGYYQNPEKTDEDYFEEEGVRFFRTGDIGELDQDGVLKIIDRKKDLVKLSLGEYVSLGKVESQLKNHPVIENICVYADSFKTHTVAVVCPDRNNLERLAAELGITEASFSSICSNATIVDRLVKLVAEHGRKSGLEKFEIPTKVYISEEPWLPDSGLVTAAFKIKRKEIFAKYQKNIQNMYL